MKTKKLLLLYSLLLFVAVMTMFFLWMSKSKTTESRDYPEIRQQGVLRMITEYNQSGYYVSGDTIEGFQYELGQAIAQLSGLQVEILLEMSLARSFNALSTSQCDIIARNIPATSELKDRFLFTDPIVLNKQVLVQRTAKANEGIAPIRNQLELAQKTLYVPENSPALLRLINLESEIGDTIYVVEEPLYSSEQLIIMVAKGDIDYAVCDQQVALKSKSQFPEIDIDTDISFTQLQSWAVRNDSPILRDSLNSWFNQLKQSGQYNTIYKKYYP